MEIKVNFNLHDLAIAALRGRDEEEKAYEAASLEHDYIYTSLFKDVMEKKIDAFHLFTRGDRVNGSEQIYHRSTKKDGYMQISYIWWKDGELLPVMDAQVKTATEMIRESSPDNVTIITFNNKRF